MLRGDFHMHTYYSYDCATTPEALVRRCERVGINCIAVTDHNSIEGSRAVQAIAPFTVILGEEIKSTAGEITGLFLKEQIEPGLSPIETAKRIKAQGALVSVPHPFSGAGRSSLDERAVLEIIDYVDIIEGFNARTMSATAIEHGRAFAVEHGLIRTAVSDAHTAGELGRTYTEFGEFDGTPEGFKQAIAEASLVERPAGMFVHVYSTVNKLRRKFWGPPRSPRA
ncbi:MAG: PHP domain-containing protein [Chloroflexi bacterium]|nr:PHP domain-containing protein [Chloroflexota bacterium]